MNNDKFVDIHNVIDLNKKVKGETVKDVKFVDKKDLVEVINLPRSPKQIGEYIGNAIAIWLTFIVIATLTGAWVKIFWIGWVFAK